jgi:hypothetical protein
VLKSVHRTEALIRDEFLAIYYSLLVAPTTLPAPAPAAVAPPPTPVISVLPADPAPVPALSLSSDSKYEHKAPEAAAKPSTELSQGAVPSSAPASTAAAPAVSSTLSMRWMSEAFWKQKWEALGHLLHSQFTSERVLAHVKRTGAASMQEFFESGHSDALVPSLVPASAAAAPATASAGSQAAVSSGGADLRPAPSIDVKSPDPVAAAHAPNAVPAAVAHDGAAEKLKKLWRDFVQSVLHSLPASAASSESQAGPTEVKVSIDIKPLATPSPTKARRASLKPNPLTPLRPCALCSLHELPRWYAGGYGPNVLTGYRVVFVAPPL